MLPGHYCLCYLFFEIGVHVAQAGWKAFKDDIKFLTLLTRIPQFWDYRRVLPPLLSVVVGTQGFVCVRQELYHPSCYLAIHLLTPQKNSYPDH